MEVAFNIGALIISVMAFCAAVSSATSANQSNILTKRALSLSRDANRIAIRGEIKAAISTMRAACQSLSLTIPEQNQQQAARHIRRIAGEIYESVHLFQDDEWVREFAGTLVEYAIALSTYDHLKRLSSNNGAQTSALQQSDKEIQNLIFQIGEYEPRIAGLQSYLQINL